MIEKFFAVPSGTSCPLELSPMGMFFDGAGQGGKNFARHVHQPVFSPLHGVTVMHAHLKSYLWFLGFLVVTKVVAAPVAKQLNIPVISDALN